MKKLIVALGAAGAIIALHSAAGRKMRGHCKEMAGRCKQMMSGQSGESSPMREHCTETIASHGRSGEEAAKPEHSQQEAPQFVGHGEAVAG